MPDTSVWQLSQIRLFTLSTLWQLGHVCGKFFCILFHKCNKQFNKIELNFNFIELFAEKLRFLLVHGFREIYLGILLFFYQQDKRDTEKKH